MAYDDHLLLQQDLEAQQTYDDLPKSLTDGHLFCVWKYETRDGKPTKVPYSPTNYGSTSTRAKSSDPATFADFETARNYFNAYPFDGMGIGFFGNLVGIDIDHCIDKDAGTISPLAMRIATTINSYTEISPSGDGLHIILEVTSGFRDGMTATDERGRSSYKARYFNKNSPQAPGVEVYIAGETNRFFTLTGKQIDLGNGGIVRERTAQLRGILDEYMRRPEQAAQTTPAPATPLDLDDQEIIERATRAKNGAAFAALWRGDTTGYGSRSEADLALCNLLSFWTGRDSERIDRLFRLSGLMRDKWEREDYRTWTIDKAIDGTANTYEPRPEQPAQLAQPTPAQVAEAPKPEKPKQPKWVDMREYLKEGGAWDTERQRRQEIGSVSTGFKQLDDYIGGGLTPDLYLIGGGPGMGKTSVALQVADGIAAQGWPVLYICTEQTPYELACKSIARTAYLMGATDDDHKITALSLIKGYYPVRARAAADEYTSHGTPTFIGADFDETIESVRAKVDEYEAQIRARGITSPLTVVVDYLQLLRSDAAGNSASEREITDRKVSALKAMQKNEGGQARIMIVLSSLNRDSYREISTKPPTLASFKESGSIEYTAAVAIMLWRFAGINTSKLQLDPDVDKPDGAVIRARIVKNRYGISDRTVWMLHNKEHDHIEAMSYDDMVTKGYVSAVDSTEDDDEDDDFDC